MKKENREKLYKIGEVAELLGVHEDTLRNWEKEGFIVPDRIGKRKDRRYTVAHIREIKEKGLVSDLAKKSPVSKKDFEEYTKDELIKELQLLKKQKKYGLVWEDHKEEVVERCKTEAPILVSKEDKRIKDKDLNKPKNILIEGDNYHALQVLNYTHKNKIDVIYIDPPYNTGNKDFIYNDSFVDREDTFRHSKWLSFMEKRLVLAKKILKNDGVIFISIDDNEMAQLKILCDGIFGGENFIANFLWRRTKTPPRLSKNVARVHDYIFCYTKNIDLSQLNNIPLNEDYVKKTYKNPDNDPRGDWRLVPLLQPDSSKNKEFSIKMPDGRIIKGKWRCSKSTFDKYIKDGRLVVSKNGVPNRKLFLSEIQGQIVDTWFDNVATNENASKEIEELFGSNSYFTSPKPIGLIKLLIKISEKKNSVILDFMAGSGTTGHAVLDLNKEDGGNRRFILCTNNELNGFEKELQEKGMSAKEIQEYGICRRITQPRIKKVIKGYTKPNGEKVGGLGGALEYFKTEFVDVENIKNVSDKKKLEFTHEAGQMIALKEDTFKEIVKNKYYQIFTDEKDKFVGIYFRENLDNLPEMEKKILDKKEVKIYIFSYGGNDFKNDYAEYKNVKVEHIPEPILKIYKSLNN